jgi:hypothetical protein
MTEAEAIAFAKGVGYSKRRGSSSESVCAASVEAAPWPPPQRALAAAEPLPPPELNLADFPMPWGEWIARAAAAAGAPPDYVACALLAVTGATIGNARWGSPWDGWKHPTIVNVACIGLPSAGKSPAIDAVAGPAAGLVDDLNEDFEERMRAWRTASQEAKERRALWEADVKTAVKEGRAAPGEPAGARDPDRPRRRRVHSTDPTIEAARDLSAANPRGLLLHRDELAGWIAGMDRYGGGGGADRPFWLQAYEGGRWTSDRVKDGDDGCDVPHLTWGIVGGIQPDRLASLLLSGEDDGLSARFIYAWPAPPASVSDPPDGIGLPFAPKPKLLRLRELPMPEDPEPVVLPFTPEAMQALQDWRREVKAMEGDAAGLYLSWLGKLPGMAVRLAVIFLHLEWLGRPAGTQAPEVVDFDAVTRAVGFLADYAVPMARRAFGEAALPEAERDARRLARWLLRQSPVPATLNARAAPHGERTRPSQARAHRGRARRTRRTRLGAPGTGARGRRGGAPARRLGGEPGTPGGAPVTTWRDRLAALRAEDANAKRAVSANSLPDASGRTAIGAIGASDTGIETPERVQTTIAAAPSRPDPWLRSIAGSVARALAEGACRERDPGGYLVLVRQDGRRTTVAPHIVASLAEAGLLPPLPQAQEVDASQLRRPPSWSDSADLPQPGEWCTCCSRVTRAGGRWWREAEAPSGWRCWTCHPPDGRPTTAVVEVRT